LNKEQGTTTRPFVVCRWRGSRHELRRARGVQCRREDGDAVKSRQNVVPSFVTGRLWGFSFKGRAGGGRADGGGRTGIFIGTGFWVLVQRSPFNTEHRGAIPGTMRETLLITSDSEAATTAVLKGDICLRTGRSGSRSSGTTLCRVSFAVFLLRAPPAERERAHSKCAKTGVGGKGVST